MSEVSSSEPTTTEQAKPVQPSNDALVLPPFPEPGDEDFDDDIGEEEREYYKSKYKDLNKVKTQRLHCSACDRHMGCSAKNENRMRSHPMLRTLMCHTCHTFYNSGEFEKGDDGSELYCRWCGQGGQVYCCSDCPHVFCAKCIKRNLGVQKIKDIESTDDWKCLKCCPRELWDLRALCWALLRFCDLKNKLVYKTEDPDLKVEYQKDCALDSSECCRDKRKRGAKKKEEIKKEPSVKVEAEPKPVPSPVPIPTIMKIPQGIQVKKFASIHAALAKPDKKAIKRAASPKVKPTMMKSPIAIQNHIPQGFPHFQPPIKRPRLSSPIMVQPSHTGIFGVEKGRQFLQYNPRIRPRPPQPSGPYSLPVMPSFNGYNNIMNDNINLSLESLTQGLDMAAVAAVGNGHNKTSNDELVCTPDFPLEPMCEVTEDNDDDVECITPGPVAAPKQTPTILKKPNNLPAVLPENIVQMTENDVTVNALTGGLKFRVDPQTLSANKMYRLPDGRIFAINPNPNMPGGYSATIVAVTENNRIAAPKAVPKGATYAAKVCAIPSKHDSSTPPPLTKVPRIINRTLNKPQRSTPIVAKVVKSTESSGRKLDMHVPVEWYRFNLVDAYDSLEYSLTRLRKLKKDATTMYLRSRTLEEMRVLHKSLDRLLHNSATRFNEVRGNLAKGMKQYLLKKKGGGVEISDDDNDNADDDDDVEILNENDDPIFIDENSMESNNASKDADQDQEVDLVSSDMNDSGEKDANSVKHLNATAETDRALDEFLSSTENGDVSITKGSEKVKSTDLTCDESSLRDDAISVDKVDESQKCDKNESLDVTDADEMEVTTTDLDESLVQTSDVKDSEVNEDKQKDNDDSSKDIDKDKENTQKDTNEEPAEVEEAQNCTIEETAIVEEAQKDTNEEPAVVDDAQKDISEVFEENITETNDDEDNDKQSDDLNNEKTLLKDNEGPDKEALQDNEISDELIETLLSDIGDNVPMDHLHSANSSEPDSILP